MLAIRIESSKIFMSQLLAGNLFDPFLLVEGMLVTSISYTFDGHINMDFYPLDERDAEHHPYEYQPWADTQAAVYSLVKGSNTPLLMRFMLQIKPEKAIASLNKELPDFDFSQVKALLINIKYEAGTVTITTGTSYKTFVMGHEADQLWDKLFCKYLSGKGIEYEIL